MRLPTPAAAINALDGTVWGRMDLETLTPPGNRRFGWLCLAYGLLILYSSTVVGPLGFHFVFRDPLQALHQFLAIRFVANGSDQRADWMGNLLMLVPFGFLVAAAVWPRRPVFRLAAAIGALLICATVILAIKYLQLFFPPRTVDLNYVAAQGIGAIIGCVGFIVWHQRIRRSAGRRNPVAALVLTLRLYTGALLIFLLMPLDFALNAADLQTQIGRLPDTVLALPGDGRPLLIRVTLIVAVSAAFIPVGMLLTFVRKGVFRVARGVLAATLIGLLLTSGIFALTTLVISASPAMAAIVYRTAGIAAGAASIRWLIKRDPIRYRIRIRAWVPWLVIPYLAMLLAVNRLWSLDWRPAHDVATHVDSLRLMPLFNYYIVTKGEAAKNIVAHLVMYLPIGVGLWFRDPGPRTARRACALAALLSLTIELGRYFRPGLEGDLNAVVLAGLSAWAAVRLTPKIWSMLTTLARQSAPAPTRIWDRRGAADAESLGEIEHF
jgi:glycopeptide antibiotics resistance protein